MQTYTSRLISFLLITLSSVVAFVGMNLLIVFGATIWPATPSGELNGGRFSEYLRKMLDAPAISTYGGDGTVRNSERLDGLVSSVFQRKIGGGCSSGTFMIGVGVDGVVACANGIPSLNSCATPEPTCSNAGRCSLTHNATSMNQAWVAGPGNCSYTCTGGWTGVSCNVPPPINACMSPRPGHTNARFETGTPTSANQAWVVQSAQTTGCYFFCNTGYVWDGGSCIDGTAGGTPDLTGVVDIAYYGDSTIKGADGARILADLSDIAYVPIPQPKGVEDRLKELGCNVSVANFGINGTRSSQLLDGYAGKLDSAPSDIIIINHALNDAGHQWVTIDEYKANLRSLIQISKSKGRYVMLETPNPVVVVPGNSSNVIQLNAFNEQRIDTIGSFVTAMTQVAAEMSVPLIDNYGYLTSQYGGSLVTVIPDGLHPNQEGYTAKALNAANVINSTYLNCTAAPPPPSYTYSWKEGTYGLCSASCGPGTQTRTVVCERNDGATVNDSFCTGTKPDTSKSCNLGACGGGVCTGPHTRPFRCVAGTPANDCNGAGPEPYCQCSYGSPPSGDWLENGIDCPAAPPAGDCDIQWYPLPSGPTNDVTIPPGVTRNFTNRGFSYIGSSLVRNGWNFTCPATPPPPVWVRVDQRCLPNNTTVLGDPSTGYEQYEGFACANIGETIRAGAMDLVGFCPVGQKGVATLICGGGTLTNSCDTQPNYTNAIFDGSAPSSPNKQWSKGTGGDCKYRCTGGYTGDTCEIAPTSNSCYGPLDPSTEQSVVDCTNSVNNILSTRGFNYNPSALEGGACTVGSIVDRNCGDRTYSFRQCGPQYCGAPPPTAPTCSDNIQNQGEGGVDCGGPCANSCGGPNNSCEPGEILKTCVGGFSGNHPFSCGSTSFQSCKFDGTIPAAGESLTVCCPDPNVQSCTTQHPMIWDGIDNKGKVVSCAEYFRNANDPSPFETRTLPVGGTNTVGATYCLGMATMGCGGNQTYKCELQNGQPTLTILSQSCGDGLVN